MTSGPLPTPRAAELPSFDAERSDHLSSLVRVPPEPRSVRAIVT